jgi:hypothetical protein
MHMWISPCSLMRPCAGQLWHIHVHRPVSPLCRGRAYPMHPHLNHLGSDICRGLLQFAQAKPLGDDGLYWLKVSVSQQQHEVVQICVPPVASCRYSHPCIIVDWLGYSHDMGFSLQMHRLQTCTGAVQTSCRWTSVQLLQTSRLSTSCRRQTTRSTLNTAGVPTSFADGLLFRSLQALQ